MLVRHVALWRQDVEWADTEGRGPALRRSDHVVDHEAHLKKGVLAFRPGLLVQAVRDRLHVLVLCQAASGWQAAGFVATAGRGGQAPPASWSRQGDRPRRGPCRVPNHDRPRSPVPLGCKGASDRSGRGGGTTRCGRGWCRAVTAATSAAGALETPCRAADN